MAASLNTARALLDAKSHRGARREVNRVLQDEPENLAARVLASDIEFDAQNFDKAVQLSRAILADNPMQVTARINEALGLLYSGKTREAAEKVEEFERDLPFMTNHVEQLKFALNANRGKHKEALTALDNFTYSQVSSDNRNEAIARYQLGDFYVANRLLRESAEKHPDDYKVSATCALSCLSLCKLSLARRYARQALSIEPHNRHMKLLIFMSYLLYFPPFCLLTLMDTVYEYVRAKSNRIVGTIVCAAFVFGFFEIYNLFIQALSVLTEIGRRPLLYSSFALWCVLFFTTTQFGALSVFNKSTKPVRLKRF